MGKNLNPVLEAGCYEDCGTERLYFSGLMDRFDAAVKRKDVSVVVAILKKAELSKENINTILRHFKLMDNRKAEYDDEVNHQTLACKF